MAAAAAAQSERGEMGTMLAHATDLEALRVVAGDPAVPAVSAQELAGDLWLQVHRFEEARAAYRRTARQPSGWSRRRAPRSASRAQPCAWATCRRRATLTRPSRGFGRARKSRPTWWQRGSSSRNDAGEPQADLKVRLYGRKRAGQRTPTRSGGPEGPPLRTRPSRRLLVTYRYRPDVLEGLWRHGVQPNLSTPPQLVHEFVSDLYRYELRRLRGRLRQGEVRKADYYGEVVRLRLKYPLISMKPEAWLES
jgi:hypothetical protein